MGTKNDEVSILDKIDLFLSPRKFRWTFWLSVLVIIIPPITWLIEWSIFEFILTNIYIIYLFLLIVLSIRRLKDDTGKFSLGPAISNYLQILKNHWGELSANIKDKGTILYLLGKKFIYIGIFCWASTAFAQFIRHLIIDYTTASGKMYMEYIRIASSFSILIIIIGAVILWLAARNNKDVEDILKGDWKYLTFRAALPGVVHRDYRVALKDKFVFDLSKKSSDDLQLLKKTLGKDLSEIMDVISSWRAGDNNFERESQYQYSLARKIQREFPLYEVETEHPEKSEGKSLNKFDILINQSIVLELKRDTKASSIKAGREQVIRYSSLWGNRGPVVLVLCQGDLDKHEVDLNNFFKTNSNLNSFAVLARKS